MRRKLAVLAVLIATFTSALSFHNAAPASACPIFMLGTLDGCDGGDVKEEVKTWKDCITGHC